MTNEIRSNNDILKRMDIKRESIEDDDNSQEEMRMLELGMPDEPTRNSIPRTNHHKYCGCIQRNRSFLQGCRDEGFLLRNEDAPLEMEMYLVCSVATILLIRLGLYATGYPQLGGNGIHIAHMLWGGLMMFISQALTMAFLGRHVRRISAILGGIGFGTFIDELGKFITSDNDYFFKPTPFILYIGFCTLFVLLKFAEPMFHAEKLSREEALANVFSLLSVYNSVGLSKDSSLLLIELLQESDPNHPLVQPIRELVMHQHDDLARYRANNEHYYIRFKQSISASYGKLWKHRYAFYALNSFFVVQLIMQIVDIALLLKNGGYYIKSNSTNIINGTDTIPNDDDTASFWSHLAESPAVQFMHELASGKMSNVLLTEETDHITKLHIFQLIGLSIGSIFVICGVYYLSSAFRCGNRRHAMPTGQITSYPSNNRRQAFLWFRRAMVVRLLVNDSLAMYHSQFRAFGEVIFTLAIVIALSIMITQETTNDRLKRLSMSGTLGLAEMESLNFA